MRNELAWNMALLDARHDSPGYQLIGPEISFGSDAEMFDYLVNYWAQCSRQMSLICQANGIEFHQVLPPNQHLAGSKPMMNEQEKTIAFLPSRYLEYAGKAYPLLVEKGKELQAEGLNYHDLTQLFSTEAAPIYIDGCCHYNPTGNERLAAAVADAVGQTEPKAVSFSW
jgi:lysophospholipase L1-like esterase